MNNIIKIDWHQIEQAAAAVASRNRGLSCVYGIPTGGSVIAPYVAQKMCVPVATSPDAPNVLIVDDLVDSGATLRPFSEDGHVVDALFRKPNSPAGLAPDAQVLDGWLEFPWEIADTGPEDAVRRLLEWIGENPNREGLLETPRRVTKALREMTDGHEADIPAILSKTFAANCDEMIAVRGIRFHSMCEHHLLPFTGTATVAYIPTDRVIGLSKIARLVEAHARRLQLQEQMTFDIANDLMTHLKPLGAACLVRAQHLCMGCRGVRKPEAEMVTSATLGLFREDAKARAEFFELARIN